MVHFAKTSRVQSLGGGVDPVTTFTDSLAPPDQPSFVGNAWSTNMLDTGGQPSTVAAQINRVGAGLNFNSTGGGSLIAWTVAFPIGLSWNTMLGKSVFVQATLVSDTSTGGGGAANGVLAGLMALSQPNSTNLYFLERNWTTLNKVRIVRSIITQALITNEYTLNAGDVLRMEVVIQPTQNVLKLIINGVTQETAIDNNVARPTTGVSGLSFSHAFVGAAVQVWSNFSIGLL